MDLIWALNNLELGGIETHTTEVLPLLKERFSVGILLSERRGRLLEKIESAGIPVYISSMKGKFNRRRISGAAKLLRQINPRIVHTHTFKAHCTIRLASILAKIPVIIPHFHSMPGERFDDSSLEWEDALLRCSSHVLFVCNAARHQYEKIVHLNPADPDTRKLRVIYDGFNLDKFYTVNNENVRNLRAHYQIDEGAPVVGLIARLAPVKSIETLIDAIDILKTSVPMLRCLIVGEGDEEYTATLKKRVMEKSLQPYITFTGYRNDVAEYIRLFTLGVLCSSHEGLPRFLVEAWASGCPVVGSDIEGLRELMVDGEDGLLVEPGNPAQLANALERLIKNKKLRDRMSQKVVLKSHDYEMKKYVDTISKVYHDLLESPDRHTERHKRWFRTKYRFKLV